MDAPSQCSEGTSPDNSWTPDLLSYGTIQLCCGSCGVFFTTAQESHPNSGLALSYLL